MRGIELVKKNKLLTAVLTAYILLLFFDYSRAISAFNTSLYYVKEMVEIMPIVFILITLIEVWIPKNIIIKGLGKESGIVGTVLSFVLGSISAGPIYAAFPLCKLLMQKGASISNIVIILSSWAVIKVPMLINEIKFLGSRFMIIRWVLTIISVFVMSKVIALLVKKEEVPRRGSRDEEQRLIYVKRQFCIGCGMCKDMYPQCFEIIDKKARIIEDFEWKENMKILEEVEAVCPAKAIIIQQNN